MMGRSLRVAPSWLGVVLFCLGCGADVRETDETGGGGEGVVTGGSGSEGGGAPAGGAPEGGAPEGGAPALPRMIDVDVLGPSDTVLQAFVNDVTGALKQTLSGADLPVQVEVVDGDLVSFLRETSAGLLLQSYRITPDVFRVREQVGVPYVSCDREPMQVTVTFPPMQNASDYWAMTDNYDAASSMKPGQKVISVESCDDTFDLIAYARDSSAILGYELLRDLPFTPGGTMAIPLTLSSTTRRNVSIQVGDLDGAESFWGYADWRRQPSMLPHESVNNVHVEQPTGTLLFAPDPIAPAPGYGHPIVMASTRWPSNDGICEERQIVRVGDTEDLLTFSPKLLASVTAIGSHDWTFGPGARGDIVWQTRKFGASDTHTWLIHEDGNASPAPVVVPELPSEIGWPDVIPTVAVVGHDDYDERDGYAALVADPLGFDQILTMRSQRAYPCE